MSAPEIKLRAPTTALLAPPWQTPLADWDPMTVAFRDIPVGPSRHLVRFVEADGDLLAVKKASDPLVHAPAARGGRRTLQVLGAIAQAITALGVIVQWPGVRWIGVTIAGLNAIVQMLSVQASPFWSVLLFSLDVLVIYVLVVHGADRD